MAREPQDQALFESSGEVQTSDPLVVFFYLLLRDELSSGRLERLYREAVDAEGPTSLTNGWVAQYAKDVARRLRAVLEKGADPKLTLYAEARSICGEELSFSFDGEQDVESMVLKLRRGAPAPLSDAWAMYSRPFEVSFVPMPENWKPADLEAAGRVASGWNARFFRHLREAKAKKARA